MNGNKKSRDTIILAVALVLLVIVAFVTLGGQKGNTVPPPSSTNNPAPVQTATATPTNDADSGKISWLDNSRLPNLVAEVKGGRNPFKDLMMPDRPRGSVFIPPPPGPYPGPGRTSTSLPPIQLPVDEVKKAYITLEWVTPQEVAKALRAEALEVDLLPGQVPDEVILRGSVPEDMNRAKAIIARLDMPPATPPFMLSGVIVTPAERLAIIILDGKQYSLMQGESIPGLGWTVKGITPTGVILMNGKQSVQLRLSGGSPS